MEQEHITNLYQWHETIERSYPWKNETNPYYIWLSEVIMQQTQSAQGEPYYLAFTQNYPTIYLLANASLDNILKLWQGLGYYSRARNLHLTAKYIVTELNGQFPTTYKQLLQLKGIGPYTAAAIASFAYQLPHAVVDGNVYRVLSRLFGIKTPIDCAEGKKEFAALAQRLLDKKEPGRYNQAIMDFGAVQCSPKTPKCNSCPMQAVCKAYKTNEVTLLPVKAKQTKHKIRYFNYLVIETTNNDTWLNKRRNKDIWQELYEFPLIETEKPISLKELLHTDNWKQWFNNQAFISIKLVAKHKQTLSHQKINSYFYHLTIGGESKFIVPVWQKTAIKKLGNFAFPKNIDWFLKENSLYLDLKSL